MAGGSGGGASGSTQLNVQSGLTPGPGGPDSSEAVPQERIVEHMVRVARASVGRGQWQVQIRLSPPELGRIRLDVDVRQDVMNMRVVADTAEARELISSRVGQLRESLQQHGITVDRVEVEPRRVSTSSGPQSDVDDGARQGANQSGAQQEGGRGFSFAWDQQGGADAGPGQAVASESQEQEAELAVDITV
jgi:flagellar hook-length control protein FliK